MYIGAEDFSGESGRARRERNLHAIYRWLVMFHFSTRELIAQALGLSAPPVRLLRWAAKAGFLGFHRYPTYGEPLLLLTEQGRREAGALYPEAVHYRSRVTAVRMNEIRHDLAVQRVVLTEAIPLDDLTPARLIKPSDLKAPDAIYERGGKRHAVEVELTVTSRQRIYIGLTDHIRAMSVDEYQAVRYLFAREAMCSLYRNLFEAPTWPRYVYARAKRAYVIDRHRPRFSIKEVPGMAERFTFSVHEALAITSPKTHPATHPATTGHAQAQAPA